MRVLVWPCLLGHYRCAVLRLFFSCLSPDFKAGEAAAKEREDAIKGTVRIKSEKWTVASTGTQQQQWSGGRCVIREGGLS